MKKTYSKPIITFESFALSTNIAEECTMDITFAEWDCPVLIPEWGETVYQEYTGCDWTPQESGWSICYHVPTLSTRIFGS